MLPITVIPLILIMIFYYMFLYKVLENDNISAHKKILVHIVDDVHTIINDPLKIKTHFTYKHLGLPEVTIFDKDMNIITRNFDMKNIAKADEKYDRKNLEGHFTEVLHSKNDDALSWDENTLLIKPILKNNKIIAYVSSDYKGTIDKRITTINQTFLYMFFIIIFTIFIIVIFVIIFSLKLLYPIKILVEAIKKVKAGNLSYTLDNTSNDEFGIVIDAFNEMTLKRKSVEDELRDMAIKDGLTGLYNHKYFYTYLESEISRGDRYNNDISMLLIDIDFFKKVNDTFGHRAGDMILSELSKRLMKRSRNTDIVCRYGGEEIAIILLETDILLAKSIAEDMRLLIEEDPFLIEDGRQINITLSIGVSTYSQTANKPSIIVSNADNALYEAKESGRNRVCVFEENVECSNEEDGK